MKQRVLQLEEVNAKLHKRILEQDAWMKEMDARTQKHSELLAGQKAQIEQQRLQIEGMCAKNQRQEKTLEGLKRADECTAEKNERAALLNTRDSGISSTSRIGKRHLTHWTNFARRPTRSKTRDRFVVVARDDVDKKSDDVDKLELIRKVRSFAKKLGSTPRILLSLWVLNLALE
jgi:hypothetical protein